MVSKEMFSTFELKNYAEGNFFFIFKQYTDGTTMLKKYSIYASFIFIIAVTSCRKTLSEDTPEVPLGTVTCYINGEEWRYDKLSLTRNDDSNWLAYGFQKYFFGDEHNASSFVVWIAKERDDIHISFHTILGGDQPTEAYTIVEGTEILEIIELDWDKRICNVRFGGTFIRKDRDTWDLDYPYRLDCYGIIHTTF